MSNIQTGEQQEAATLHRIVVGVDGSPGSLEALDWAATQAKQSNAVLDIVTAWNYPNTYGSMIAFDINEIEQAAKALAEKAVARATERAPGVVIRNDIVEEPGAQALVDASRGADLLVVGSRGLGGFTGALIGSVSLHCARHSHCPVVIMRHAD
jgi:nucleotide-binding universal stress UspA family protein